MYFKMNTELHGFTLSLITLRKSRILCNRMNCQPKCILDWLISKSYTEIPMRVARILEMKIYECMYFGNPTKYVR